MIAASGMRAPARLFIGGNWCLGSAGTAEVIDPATEQATGAVTLAGPADLEAAIASAVAVRAGWASVPAGERGAILQRASALLKERGADVARALTLEQGKTLTESMGEINRAIETLAWNGDEAGQAGGKTMPGRARNSVRMLVPAPIGVVAAFAAWNFPAVLATRKLGAALAAGCPVILKAAEEAPYTAASIVQCLADAGVPAGAVNLVFGDPPKVAARLLASPEIRKVTFTGSTRVGKELARLAAPDLKRCTFELGGHAPVILCADCDIDAAVGATMAFKFASAGQSCIAPSRFYIHRSRYDEFTAKFTAAAKALKVGNGFQPDMQMGPVANERRLDAMQRLTEDALGHGAELATGGKRHGAPGFFWSPTVLLGVSDQAAVMNEEPFGPIAPMDSFDEVDEAIARGNRIAYGFAAYIFTRSSSVAAKFVAEIEAGNLGINQMSPSLPDAPVGGVKDSGYGYEGGSEGIAAFQQMKLVNQTFLP
jgi:succinate-semialdehyde dehydrogenase / glutarate-semialdehyde dehydrogenase